MPVWHQTIDVHRWATAYQACTASFEEMRDGVVKELQRIREEGR